MSADGNVRREEEGMAVMAGRQAIMEIFHAEGVDLSSQK
jgi:hypothetical protein